MSPVPTNQNQPGPLLINMINMHELKIQPQFLFPIAAIQLLITLCSSKVRNTREGGILVVAPPCCLWIFMSSSVTGRSWANPGGNPSQRLVALANILVRRLLYMLPGPIGS